MGHGASSKMKYVALSFVLSMASVLAPAYAHEAYVLDPKHFQLGFQSFTSNPLAPVFDPANFQVMLYVTIFFIGTFAAVIAFSATRQAAYLDKIVKKARVVGPLIIRFAIGTSFLYAAMSNVVLGPELQLSGIYGPELVRFALFAIGLMSIFGVFVEAAALVGIAIFAYMTLQFGSYMVTYLNYLGELVVMLMFGSRFLSFDRLFFGKRLLVRAFERLKEYEVPIVRIFYGAALLFAGYTVKFLHQSLTVDVFNQYHIVNYIPLDPSLVAALGGLGELTVGAFIIGGFATRWTVGLSLIFITTSLLYFHELLWPHLMLYGISMSLLINSSDRLSLERRVTPFVRRILSGVLPPSIIRRQSV